MNWLKNLFNKKNKIKPEWQSIERDEKGRWIVEPKPLLGVVKPHADTTCKCGGKCDNCAKELDDSMNRHPAGKKKTNATDNKPSSGTKKSVESNNPVLDKNGKTKSTPTSKPSAPKSNGTRKPKDTK